MAEKQEEENIELQDRVVPEDEPTGSMETPFDDNLLDIPNIGIDAGVMRRSITQDRKNFLRDHLNLRLNKGDGPYSKELYENMEIVLGANGKVNGIKYKDKKIVVYKEGRFDYSSSRANEILVQEFKELVEKAKLEHAGTADAMVEEQLPSTSSEVVTEVVRGSLESLEEYIGDQYETLVEQSKELPPNVRREVRGVLQGGVFDQNMPVEKKLDTMEIDRQHWIKMSEEAEGEDLKKLYKHVADIESLQMDVVRLRFNLKPETDVAREIIENEIQTNDLARFERLKQWLKKNFGTISGVMVGVAGIVTAVVVSTRTYVRKGAKAVKSVAKGVAKVAEKVGPLIGAVLGLVAKTLGLGAKGLTLLSNNLWILVVLLVGYLYKKYTNKK